jgi:hypothetical protein
VVFTLAAEFFNRFECFTYYSGPVGTPHRRARGFDPSGGRPVIGSLSEFGELFVISLVFVL